MLLQIDRNFAQKAEAMCQLCQSLHEDKTHKVYDDLQGWWAEEAQCREIIATE